MVNLAATVAAATVAFTLLAAAFGHARRPGALAAALRAHAVLPARLAGPIAAAVAGAEAVLGLAIVTGATEPALACTGGLFAAYAGYAAYVRRVRPERVPCGCAGSGVALTGWVVGRAVALAGVALLGWLLAPSVLALQWRPEVAVALCAAGTFACLLGQLPAAMTSAEVVRA